MRLSCAKKQADAGRIDIESSTKTKGRSVSDSRQVPREYILMNRSKCDILIRNGQVITMDSERRIYRPGAVAISGSRIVEVGADADLRDRFDARKTVDAEGGIVHPGFIDAHNHIVHTSCRGVFGDVRDTASPVNFADWKAGVTAEDEAAATVMAGLEMLRGGFTMFIEPGSLFHTEAAAEAVERVGLRSLFGPLYLWDRQRALRRSPLARESEPDGPRARGSRPVTGAIGRGASPQQRPRGAGPRVRLPVWPGNRVARTIAGRALMRPRQQRATVSARRLRARRDGDISRSERHKPTRASARVGCPGRAYRHRPRERAGRG